METNFHIISSDYSPLLTVIDDTEYDGYCSANLTVINVLVLVKTTGEKVICKFKDSTILQSDGWFRVYHIVLPDCSALTEDSCSVLYKFCDNNFFKVENGNLVRVNPLEVLEINPDSVADFGIAYKDIFNDSYIHDCLISSNVVSANTCSTLLDPCGNNKNCRRNHIQSILSMLEYYVNCGSMLLAQLLLEDFSTCFDLCGLDRNPCLCSDNTIITNPCGCNG